MPELLVRIMCPNLACRKVLSVPGTARGKTVRCRGCGTNIRVPAPSPGEAKPAADRPGADRPAAEKPAGASKE